MYNKYVEDRTASKHKCLDEKISNEGVLRNFFNRTVFNSNKICQPISELSATSNQCTEHKR